MERFWPKRAGSSPRTRRVSCILGIFGGNGVVVSAHAEVFPPGDRVERDLGGRLRARGGFPSALPFLMSGCMFVSAHAEVFRATMCVCHVQWEVVA